MTQEQRWRIGASTAMVALLVAFEVAPRSIAGSLVPFVAFFLLIIPVHELGHAVAGLLVGHRIVLVRLGVGPRLFTFKVSGTAVELNALPLAGATLGFPSRPRRGARGRAWLFAAGGLVANAALAYALRKHGISWKDDDPHRFLSMAASANWTVMMLNLIPFRLPEGAMTDGYHLFTIPFWSRAQIDRVHIVAETQPISDAAERGDLPRALELAEVLRRRYPTHPGSATTLGYVLSRLRRYDEATALWREALEQTKEPATVLLLKNNIAWVTAIVGRPEELAEADGFSDEALAAAHEAPGVRGTRGAVLARLGRGAEALPLLEQSLDNPSATQRQYTKCFIARALLLEGRVEDARRALEEARRLDPSCELIPWIEAAIEGAGREPALVAAPVAPGAAARAETLRRWRRDAHILSFAAMLGVSGHVTTASMYLLIVPIFVSIVPEESGVLALAASYGWATLIQIVGQWPSDVPCGATTLRDALVALAVAAAAGWLSRRYQRLGPQPRTRVPLVLGIVLSLLAVLQGLAAVAGSILLATPAHVHATLATLVQQGTGLMAVAAIWATSPRRWIRALALVPAVATLVAAIGGSTWYLEHRVLAGVPPTGAPIAWQAEQPAKQLRARSLAAPGVGVELSPTGQAFAVFEGERPRLRVADFGSRLVEVDGSTAVFLDDESLLVVRPAAGSTSVSLAEVRPFASPEPVWIKDVPRLTAVDVRLVVDQASRTAVLAGSDASRTPRAWRTGVDAASPFIEIRSGWSLVDEDDTAVATFLGRDGGGHLILRGADRSLPRALRGPGDLWLIAPSGASLLARAMDASSCASTPDSIPVVWCWPSDESSPVLLRVDTARAVVQRVPGNVPWVREVAALDRSHLAILGQALGVVDLEGRRGARLALPKIDDPWERRLATGALAVYARGKADKLLTISVYDSPFAAGPGR